MNQLLGNCCVIVAVIMTLLIVKTTQQPVIIDYNIEIRDYATTNRQIYNNSTSVCFGQNPQFAGWRMYRLAVNHSRRMFSVVDGNNIYFMQFNGRRVVLIRGNPPTEKSFYVAGANATRQQEDLLAQPDPRLFECQQTRGRFCYIKHVATQKMLYASISENQVCRNVKATTTNLKMRFKIGEKRKH